jgi:uncharacterized protein YndB with AHSA1/START domain
MSNDELRLERTFKAPRERVFDAWTDPSIMARWFGPANTAVDQCELEPRVGGRYRLVVRAGEGKTNEVSGEYRTIRRPSMLVFTWAWTQADGSRGHEYTIEVGFAETPQGTRLTLVQHAFVDAEQRANHQHGWQGSFDKLDEQLAAAESQRA